MAHFTVTLADTTIDHVEHADAYQQEGPLTTFFAFTGDRRVIDSWSVRLASYRTADITAIRRAAIVPDASGPVTSDHFAGDPNEVACGREPVRCRPRTEAALLVG